MRACRGMCVHAQQGAIQIRQARCAPARRRTIWRLHAGAANEHGSAIRRAHGVGIPHRPRAAPCQLTRSPRAHDPGMAPPVTPSLAAKQTALRLASHALHHIACGSLNATCHLMPADRPGAFSSRDRSRAARPVHLSCVNPTHRRARWRPQSARQPAQRLQTLHHSIPRRSRVASHQSWTRAAPCSVGDSAT
jgi:hypothetical protein